MKMQSAVRSPRPYAVGDSAASKTLGSALLVVMLWSTALALLACSSAPSFDALEPDLSTPVDDHALVDAAVLRVIDGASIEVRDTSGIYGVRYMGIDIAPNGSPRLKAQADSLNRYLVEGKTVQLERDFIDTDAAGVRLRYVYVDGEMVNLALLAGGLATVASSPPAFAYRASFLAVAAAARTSVQGESNGSMVLETPSGPQAFGTLPTAAGIALRCDFSGTAQPLIKAKADPLTGERVYHVPGGFEYPATVIEQASGDRWYCNEGQAVADGWKRSPE